MKQEEKKSSLILGVYYILFLVYIGIGFIQLNKDYNLFNKYYTGIYLIFSGIAGIIVTDIWYKFAESKFIVNKVKK